MIQRVIVSCIWFALVLLLAGCTSSLVFFERSSLKLGVSVGEDPTTPVEVTVGLKRTVVSRVPPTQDGEDGSAAGDAASLLADFDLAYDQSGEPMLALTGNLRIDTLFASGEAAKRLATDADATMRFLGFDEDAITRSASANDLLQSRSDRDEIAGLVSQLVSAEFKAEFDRQVGAGESNYDALLDARDKTCGLPVASNPNFEICFDRVSGAIYNVLQGRE